MHPKALPEYGHGLRSRTACSLRNILRTKQHVPLVGKEQPDDKKCPSRLSLVHDSLTPNLPLKYATSQQNTTKNAPYEIGQKSIFSVFTSKLTKNKYIPVEKVTTYCLKL